LLKLICGDAAVTLRRFTRG